MKMEKVVQQEFAETSMHELKFLSESRAALQYK